MAIRKAFLQDEQWNTCTTKPRTASPPSSAAITSPPFAPVKNGPAAKTIPPPLISIARFSIPAKRNSSNSAGTANISSSNIFPINMQRSRGEVGPGCMSDQLIGQWWAHQLNLGYILPREMVASALRSIYKYNFKSDLTGWKHAPRSYAGAKDKGLIVCTWPKGGRPENVLLYSDEVWTGLEYEVAALLIYEEMITEGLSVAKAARDRYDGVPRPPIKRNPWCEIECGGHYTRAMSSWSILLALSGAYYDGPKNLLRFTPFTPDNYKSFFTTATAFGSYAQTKNAPPPSSPSHSGQLTLQTLQVPYPDTNITIALNNQRIPATVRQSVNLTELQFQSPPLTNPRPNHPTSPEPLLD